MIADSNWSAIDLTPEQHRPIGVMSSKWLLIETFSGEEPSVIGLGSSPKKISALTEDFRGTATRSEALDAAAEAVSTKTRVDRRNKDGQLRVVADPLCTYSGRVHGTWLWIGSKDEVESSRDAAGAWLFNLTLSTASGSDDLLDLYTVPPDERHTEKALAGAFTLLVTNHNESQAMA
nr:GAF domain-containing protein [Rhodococcus sp. (in: high G+C Gram-positive bacteria)]